VRPGARGAARGRALPQKSQGELLDILQQIQRYLPKKQRELGQMLTEIQPVPQVLQEPAKLHQMLADDPDKLQRLLESQMHHETEKLKSQKPGLEQMDAHPGVRQVWVDDNERRIRRLETLQEFRHQDQPELKITQKITELRDEIQDILYGVQQQLPNANLQTGVVDALYRRAKAVRDQITQLRTDKGALLDRRQALQQENQEYLARLQANLPDPKSVFKLKDNGEGEYRFRMASDLVDIPGMTKYYIAWCDIHGRNLGAQGDIMAPVQGGLAAAQDAILRQDRSARDGQALGGIGTAGQQTEGNGYHAPNSTVEGHKRRIGTADAVRNSLVLVNAGGKFGVLMDHEKFHGPQPGNDPETGKPYGRWDLANSRGDYRPYTQYVAPIAGGILGGYGGVTAALSAGTSIYDANRKRQNQEVGGSKLDTAQSSLDAGAAILSSASGFWSAADSVASIAGPAANLGGATVWVPVLSGAAGLINAVSGGMESERARRAEIKIDSAQKELGRLSDGAPAPGPSGGIKSDQQQLEEAMQHTRMVTHLHQRSGGLKAAAGAAQVAASVSTLAGGAPVAAAFQGTAAILSIAKVAFDRGYKWYMRRKVVGTYYNIDWSQEMDDVREMIKAYNPKFHLRDKDVRAIILRAHGSEQETRTDAFKGINRKRAKYLIDTANDDNSEYHVVAGLVVESMGIHKIGNSFAAGAIDLLSEKLAGA
jgi:hypothetical protein